MARCFFHFPRLRLRQNNYEIFQKENFTGFDHILVFGVPVNLLLSSCLGLQLLKTEPILQYYCYFHTCAIYSGMITSNFLISIV